MVYSISDTAQALCDVTYGFPTLSLHVFVIYLIYLL